MSLIRNIRIYANRCPHCGKRMRLYSWTTAPFQIPALTNARVCVNKHYVRMEHVPTGRITEIEEQGRPVAILADVSEFPDPLEEEKPIHTNLNMAQRKPPAPAKPAPPAAPAAAPAPAAAAAPAASPAAPAPATSSNGDGAPKPAPEPAAEATTSQT